MTEGRVPQLTDSVPMGDADRDGAWKHAGDNDVWSRFVPDGGPELELFELFDEGVVPVPVGVRTMHVIPAGRPYRLAHVYGFWRAAEADTVFLRSPAPGGTAYMLVTGTTYSTYKKDRVFWICPKCKHELASTAIPRTGGLAALLAKSAAAVRAFNADPATRTCPACGHVHPEAYAMEPQHDDAAEAAARAAW